MHHGLSLIVDISRAIQNNTHTHIHTQVYQSGSRLSGPRWCLNYYIAYIIYVGLSYEAKICLPRTAVTRYRANGSNLSYKPSICGWSDEPQGIYTAFNNNAPAIITWILYIIFKRLPHFTQLDNKRHSTLSRHFEDKTRLIVDQIHHCIYKRRKKKPLSRCLLLKISYLS